MRRNSAKAMLIAAIMATPSLGMATEWNIDADHSNVGFSVSHLMVSHVKGNFNKYSGVVDINDKDITKSSVNVTIDAASINTNVQKRDEHLKSADFFDVAKYPTLSFVSKKWIKAAKGALKVSGDLTMCNQACNAYCGSVLQGEQGSMGKYKMRNIGKHNHQPQGLRSGLESGSRNGWSGCWRRCQYFSGRRIGEGED